MEGRTHTRGGAFRALALIIAVAVGAALAACGGGDDGNGSFPTLAGTPIPTAPPPTPTTAVCTPPAPVEPPADFPPDVIVPPDYEVWSVERTPHLRVTGRVTPPVTDQAPHAAAAGGILSRMPGFGWMLSLEPRVEGLEYIFSHADGRVGRFNSHLVLGCPEQAEITYDIEWMTG